MASRNIAARTYENRQLSDDLYPYFLLEARDCKTIIEKLVTLVTDSEYDTKVFVKTLSTNFHDLHLTQRRYDCQGLDNQRSGPRRHGKFAKRRRGGDRVLVTGEADESDDDKDDSSTHGESDDNSNSAQNAGDDQSSTNSDRRASQDEDITEAYSAYNQATQKSRTHQRQRGF